MTDTANLLGLDHIVIAVDDLDETIDDYRALGFSVVPGGQHPGRSSHNALVVFQDGAYLELIAWQAPAAQERWWRTLQAQGEGFVDYALLPRDTEAVLAAARSRGLDSMDGPLPGGRLRPDGAKLQWVTARQATPALPFLCGDVTPRALRVPEGELRTHANGATGVLRLTVLVADPGDALRRYRALLGPSVAIETDPGALPAQARPPAFVASFALGTQRVVLVSPRAGVAEDAPLAEHLSGRGEGVIGLRLAGPAVGALAPERTHGAAIVIGAGSGP